MIKHLSPRESDHKKILGIDGIRLVELVVVVVILLILAAVVIFAVRSASEKRAASPGRADQASVTMVIGA